MAKTDFKTIDEYHVTFSSDQQKRMNTIRKLILEIVPDAEQMISYQIPCFKYRGYLIYYSAYSRHISLSYPYSEAFLACFRDKLKGYKVSKSAIQFPHNEPLPLDLIRDIITFRKKENEKSQ